MASRELGDWYGVLEGCWKMTPLFMRIVVGREVFCVSIWRWIKRSELGRGAWGCWFMRDGFWDEQGI